MKTQSNYLELIAYKAYADLRAEAARTYAGYLWWIVEPLLHMTIYYVVFGLLLRRAVEDFIPFLLIGITTWKWFETSVRRGAGSILANANLMRQVPLPKIIFPTIAVLTDSVKFAVAFCLLLLFSWWYGFGVGAPYLALPFVILTEVLLLFATAALLAALVPFLPDLRIVVDNFLRLLFFLSGIFYAASSISEKYSFYLYLNPMVTVIESYRKVMMYQEWPSWNALVVISLVSCVAIAFAHVLLKRYDASYPRLVT